MMNKRALLLGIKKFLNSDKAGRILGGSAGAAIGGLGGALLTGALTDNKALRILGAVAGASAGGYGGYRVGSYMDTQRAGLRTDLSNANTLNKRLDAQNNIYKDLIEGWKANDLLQKKVRTRLLADLKALKTRGDNLSKQLDIGAQQYAKAVAGNAKAKSLIDEQEKRIQLLEVQKTRADNLSKQLDISTQQYNQAVELTKNLLQQIAKLNNDIEELRKLRLIAIKQSLDARVDLMNLADKYDKSKNALYELEQTNKLYDTWLRQHKLKLLKLRNLLYKYAPEAASQYK